MLFTTINGFIWPGLKKKKKTAFPLRWKEKKRALLQRGEEWRKDWVEERWEECTGTERQREKIMRREIDYSLKSLFCETSVVWHLSMALAGSKFRNQLAFSLIGP